MTTPEVPDSHKDLLDAQIGVLGTVGGNGRPQLSAVWFLGEADGTVRISLNSSRQKLKNLQARPQASLLIQDPASGYRYLEIRGAVDIADDPDYAFAKKIGAKYGGADVRDHDGPADTRHVVTITPDRVVAWG
jgi:PPOX class probable F420-dependent enzyme